MGPRQGGEEQSSPQHFRVAGVYKALLGSALWSDEQTKAQRREDGLPRTHSSLAAGLDSNQRVQRSSGLKAAPGFISVTRGGEGLLLREPSRLGTGGGWGWRTAAAPHLQPWPRAQQLGRPASSLILLSRGDPAFCQSGGRQQGEGWGGGGTSVPWRTGMLTPDTAPLSFPTDQCIYGPLQPTGKKQTGQGDGVESSPRNGRESAPQLTGGS